MKTLYNNTLFIISSNDRDINKMQHELAVMKWIRKDLRQDNRQDFIILLKCYIPIKNTQCPNACSFKIKYTVEFMEHLSY